MQEVGFGSGWIVSPVRGGTAVNNSEDAVFGAEDATEDPQEELSAHVEEEADVAKPLPIPDTPTRSEFMDHCVAHCPYRSWCRHCVEGRGREIAHSSSEHGPREVPTRSSDYAFVGDAGDITTQEQADVEEGSIKILVVRDNVSKAVFAHVVPKKGFDDKGFAVDSIVGDVK